MERVLGLDVGDRRIGIAMSDELGIIAQPIGVHASIGWGPDVRYIKSLATAHGITRVICGLPSHIDGREGEQAEKVRAFGHQLEKSGLIVEYWDERLTSVSAERSLLEGGLSRQERRSSIDKIAAALILQNYLDAMHRKKEEEKTVSEAQENIVELIGEDGESVRFEHLMTVEHKGGHYLILTIAEPKDEDEAADVIIMRISQDEKGEDCYVLEEDEAIAQAVFEQFIELMDQEDDAIPDGDSLAEDSEE